MVVRVWHRLTAGRFRAQTRGLPTSTRSVAWEKKGGGANPSVMDSPASFHGSAEEGLSDLEQMEAEEKNKEITKRPRLQIDDHDEEVLEQGTLEEQEKPQQAHKVQKVEKQEEQEEQERVCIARIYYKKYIGRVDAQTWKAFQHLSPNDEVFKYICDNRLCEFDKDVYQLAPNTERCHTTIVHGDYIIRHMPDVRDALLRVVEINPNGKYALVRARNTA